MQQPILAPFRRRLCQTSALTSTGAAALLLAALPAAAQTQSPTTGNPVIPATDGNAPGLDYGGNGAPVINITRPNDQGASYNRYQQFNVDGRGVVLNNAERVVETKVAGYIDGNRNLAGTGGASLIINEVVAANPSNLAGYIEVAGRGADVILANPWGIACDGCGFINTPTVTLTTGAVQRDGANNLTGYAAPVGSLVVNGRGLDATAAKLNLFARAIQINAGLYADEVNAGFGSGSLDRNGDVVVIGKRDDSTAAPRFGLDVAALGGMYARTIKLVGTEQGLGVNVSGDLAGLERGVSLSADGKVAVGGTISAATDAVVKSTGDLDIAGQIYGGKTAVVAAAGLTGNGLTASGGDVSVTAGTINSGGTFAAGLGADGKLTQAGTLTMTSSGALTLTGMALARDALALSAAQLGNRGTISGGAVTVKTGALTNDASVIDSRGLLDVATGAVSNKAGVIQSAGALTLTAASLDNQGGAVAALGTGTLTATIGGAVTGANGQIGGNGDVKLTAGSLGVDGAKGTVTAAKALTVSAGTIAVTGGGLIASTGAASITSDTGLTVDDGAVQSSAALTVRATTITLGGNGRISGADSDVAASGAVANAGLIGATGGLKLTAGTVTNGGTLVGQTSLVASASGTFAQTGRISSGGDVTLTAGDVAATGGSAEAGGKLSVAAGGIRIENSSLLAFGGGPLSVAGTDALSLSNARIGGNGDVALSGAAVTIAGGSVTAQGGLNLIARDGDLRLTGDRLLAAGGDIGLGAKGTLAYAGSDLASGAKTLSLKATTIENRGGILHGGAGALNVAATTLDNRGGTIAGGAAGALVKTDTLLNDGGMLGAGGTAGITAGRLDNGAGTIASGSMLTVNAASLNVAGNGRLWADQDALVTTSATLVNRGTIAAAHDLKVRAAGLDGAGGTLAGGDLLDLQTGGGSAGTLIAPTSLTLGVAGDLTNAAGDTIDAAKSLTLNVGGSFTNAGKVSAGDTLDIGAGSALTNAASGTIIARTVNLKAGGALTNQGLINGGNVALSGGEIVNGASIFGDRVALDGGRITNAGGSAIIATRSGLLSLASAGDIIDRDGASLFSLGDLTIAGAGGVGRAASLQNLSGSIQAQGNIAIAATNVVNDRADFATEEAVVSTQNGRDQITSGDFRITTTYTDTATQTRITRDTGPARIVGSNVAIDAAQVTNNISTISASGNLTIVGSVANTAFTGYDTTTRVGTIQREEYVCTLRIIFCLDHDWRDRGTTPFTSLLQKDEAFTVPSVIASNGTLAIDGRDIANLTLTSGGKPVDIFAASVTGGTIGAPGKVAGSGVDPTFGFAIAPPADRAGGGAAGAVLAVGGLFRFAAANAQYLIESDTRFTNYNSFVSSDVYVAALGLDPTRVQRRLGDGLYEQQLIANQLVALTGAQRLGGYTDNQAQYLALLQSGATYAKSIGLGLGIGLSDQQVATLTSDIVILVETTVQTPSGPQTVLAPKVYLTKVSSRDVTSGGAVIAGRDLQLRAADSLANAGVIRASVNGTLLGGDVTNGGRLDLGAQGIVSASRDLTDRGGVMTGGDLTLAAGRNLTLDSVATTRTVATVYRGSGDQSIALTTGTTNRGTSIAASGNLQLLAGGTVSATGADATAGGDVAIAARDGIALSSTVDRTQTLTIGNQGKTNYSQTQTDQRNVLTTIKSGGATTLATDGALTLKGATVDSAGALTAQADRIDVQGVIDQTDLDRETVRKKSGFLSTTKTTTSYSGTDQAVVGSTLSGNTVALSSIGDTRIAGSNVVADNGVAIRSGGAIDIAAMAENDSEKQSTKVKKSGLSIGGGGLFIGVAKTQNDVDTTSLTNGGSIVGSTAGDVTLDANRALTVTGSQVVGTGTTRLTGESIAIRNATDVTTTDTLSKSSSIGISIGVQSPLLAGLEGVRNSAKIVGNPNANARTTAVAGLAGGLAAYNSYDALTVGGGNVVDNLKNSGSISVSFGVSSSKSTSSTRDETSVASRIAGNDVVLAARGAGADSTILVQGSTIDAARDLALSAPGAITLRSAAEIDTLAQNNKSSGFSIGVSYGAQGLTPNASFNAAKGNAAGIDTRYAETLLNAGRDLAIDTGGALTLQGARVSGDRIVIDAAGLAIRSEQDTSIYNSKQNGFGLSLSTSGGGAVGGNVSRSRQNGDFASVSEQSGIYAGSRGYDITVTGNTDLVGGVIASQAAADANRLVTGTLTASDIVNRESYSASSLSLGGGIGDIRKSNGGVVGQPGSNPVPGIATGIGTISATPPVALGAKGGQSSTTYSAIAPGTITITSGDPASEATAAGIRRDTGTANAGALTQQFTDAKREEIALGFAAANQLANQTGTFFANRAEEQRQAADAAKPFERQAIAAGVLTDEAGNPLRDEHGNLIALNAQAQAYVDQARPGAERAWDLNRTFGAGSPVRLVATAINGAAGSNVTGSVGSLVRASTVNVLQGLGAQQIKGVADTLGSEPARAALQGIVGCAGSAAGGSGSCGSAAMGAAASVVLNDLLTTGKTSGTDANGQPLTLAEQQGRDAIVGSLVAAIATGAGLDTPTAVTASSIEGQNNSQRDVNGNLIVRDPVAAKPGESAIANNLAVLDALKAQRPGQFTELVDKFGGDTEEGRLKAALYLAYSADAFKASHGGEAAVIATVNGVYDQLVNILSPDLLSDRQLYQSAQMGRGDGGPDISTSNYALGKMASDTHRPSTEQLQFAAAAVLDGSVPLSQLGEFTAFYGGVGNIALSGNPSAVGTQLGTAYTQSRAAFEKVGQNDIAYWNDPAHLDEFRKLPQSRRDELTQAYIYASVTGQLLRPISTTQRIDAGINAVGHGVVATLLGVGAAGTLEACATIIGCALPASLALGAGTEGDNAVTDFNRARTGMEQQTTGGYLISRVFSIDATTGERVYVVAQVANGVVTGTAANATMATRAVTGVLARSTGSALPMEGATIRSEMSAESVNATFSGSNPVYDPPYTPGTKVIEFTTTQETYLVRVTSDPGTAGGGSFYVQASDIVGKTPEEIRVLLGLEQTPTYIQSVRIPSGSVLREGKVGPQLKFSNSPLSPGNTVSPGGIQYQSPFRQPFEFGDLVPLPAGKPVK